MKRGSGILMHITSLNGKDGIGTLGKEAFDFVDFLKESKQSYWQVLPMGTTSYGDSPYQSFSAFAGNPYLIDLDWFVKEGVLSSIDYVEMKDGDRVNYELIYKYKLPILRKAFKKSNGKFDSEIEEFSKEQAYWLEDYALFMALKGKNQGKSWLDWEDAGERLAKKERLEELRKELKEEIDYYKFIQYVFYKQWNTLKAYANKNSIKIIGDIPIFVAVDSVDVWKNTELFLFDEEKKPKQVAGCPPDAFSATGQLWGNPHYDWAKMKENGYAWWIERMRTCEELFDILRIDHFRGFESYWVVPYGAPDASNGYWEKGPGMDLFNAIKEKLGDLPIIAEDLGFITPEVRQLLDDSGFPGMKVLQFAFDTRDDNSANYWPEKYTSNSVAYTGTHDNDTVRGWFELTGVREDVETAKSHFKIEDRKDYDISWLFIEEIWKSASNIVIAPMQDFLSLGNESRMNHPSTLAGNWQWKIGDSLLNRELSEKIAKLTKESKRD